MLEAILILACLNPSGDSCGKTTEAYGKQSGLEKMIQDFGDRNPTIAFFVGSAGLYREKRLYYKIMGPWHHNLQVDGGGVSQTVWFKKDF